MSEGTSIIDTTASMNNKSNQLFQTQTSHFQADPSIARRCHESSPDAIPVLLHGSKSSRTTIGRGKDATIKIGKSNKRVSREHAVIEHKPQWNGFEITILSPNGALIDHITFAKGENVPILEGTLIEIVGTKMIFKVSKDDELDLSVAQEPVKKQEECITIPIINKITDKEADIHNTITHINEPMAQAQATATINQFIKSTASRLKQTTRNIIKKPLTLEDQIVQVLVYTRKSTMTCSDITKRLEGELLMDVSRTLNNSPVIGCVKRLGKTADGSPKENLYYYKAELDPDQERRKRYSDVGRSARKCTMKDTQYFFRIPPKLPNQKSRMYSSNKVRKRRSKQAKEQQEDDELLSDSSGDASDMEVYELFKDVQ